MLKIGETLKECRELKGLTLGGLSSLSGLSKSYLSKIENDKRDPSLGYLNQICKALNIPLSIFILLADTSDDAEFSEITKIIKSTAKDAIRGNPKFSLS